MNIKMIPLQGAELTWFSGFYDVLFNTTDYSWRKVDRGANYKESSNILEAGLAGGNQGAECLPRISA